MRLLEFLTGDEDRWLAEGKREVGELDAQVSVKEMTT